VTINFDSGSNTICFFQNGMFDDGGDARQYGWRRFSPYYRNEFLGEFLVFAKSSSFTLERMEVFARLLMAAEIEALDKALSGCSLFQASESLPPV
jgi:hypothetical protein